MTQAWHLLSPRPAHEIEQLAAACARAVAAFRAARGPHACGEVTAGGPRPTAGQVVAAYRAMGLNATVQLVERLDDCESVLTIERPADLDTAPLQVAVLRALLDEMGRGLVLLDGFPLLTPDEARRRLQGKRTVRGFAAMLRGADAEEEAPEEERVISDRAANILARFEAAEEDPDLALDLSGALRRLPELCVRYARLLVEQGALPDTEAARRLGVSEKALADAAAKLAAVVEEL